jgi:hypothetical protein
LTYLAGSSPAWVRINHPPITIGGAGGGNDAGEGTAEGMYQTATQVKGLSPVMFNVKEADGFHLRGRLHEPAR